MEAINIQNGSRPGISSSRSVGSILWAYEVLQESLLQSTLLSIEIKF